MRDFGAAAALVEDEAEIVYRKGRFYVTDAAGPRVFERHIFFKNFRRMAQAIQDCHAVEGAEIIPFREDVRAAH